MIEKKRGGRPSKKPDEAQLSMLYSGMTAKELAEHYGVSVSTVQRWIAEYRKESKNEEAKRREAGTN